MSQHKPDCRCEDCENWRLLLEAEANNCKDCLHLQARIKELEAEVERLTSELSTSDGNPRVAKLSLENKRLEAEVKRLKDQNQFIGRINRTYSAQLAVVLQVLQKIAGYRMLEAPDVYEDPHKGFVETNCSWSDGCEWGWNRVGLIAERTISTISLKARVLLDVVEAAIDVAKAKIVVADTHHEITAVNEGLISQLEVAVKKLEELE